MYVVLHDPCKILGKKKFLAKNFLTIGVSTLVKADILKSFSIHENSKTNVFLTSITFILIGSDDVKKKKV